MPITIDGRKEGDAGEGPNVGAYREIVYGLLFFLSACAGAAITAYIDFFLMSIDFPEYPATDAVRVAPYGAAIGGLVWLVFRYAWLKDPRK